RHWMTRVAQKHHASVTPTRQRFTFEDCPFVAIRTCLKYSHHIRMKTFILFAQFSYITFGRPGFLREPMSRFRHAGYEVNLTASRRRVIDDDVAIDAPPFRSRGTDIFAFQ